jgi:hypothetical protein
MKLLVGALPQRAPRTRAAGRGSAQKKFKVFRKQYSQLRESADARTCSVPVSSADQSLLGQEVKVGLASGGDENEAVDRHNSGPASVRSE